MRLLPKSKQHRSTGYDAIQVASFDKTEKNVSTALMGHLNKADARAKRVIREFRGVAS
jgi:Ribosomal protein L3